MSNKAKDIIQKQTPVSVLYLYDYSLFIIPDYPQTGITRSFISSKTKKHSADDIRTKQQNAFFILQIRKGISGF